MLKINYPVDLTGLRDEYWKLFEKDVDAPEFEAFMGEPEFYLSGMSIKEILTGDFKLLLDNISILSGLKDEPGYLDRVKLFFDYEKFQPKIAKFFMKHEKTLELYTCFYCNIDYINVFADLQEYKDPIELVNNASKEELVKIKNIGEASANFIISERRKVGGITSIDTIDKISDDAKNSLKHIETKDMANHFTLDHLIAKGSYPLYALSLHNLVPCCSGCNSKFKSDDELFDKDGIHYLSPSSDEHSFERHVEFKLLYRNGNWQKTGHKNDLRITFEILDNVDEYKRFIKSFKLSGRYAYHKREAIDLIDKRRRYSDARMVQIAKLVKMPVDKIKEDVFGSELFNGGAHKKPLNKFRRDIARNIGIKGVRKDI